MIIKHEMSLWDFEFWGVDDELLDMLDSTDWMSIESQLEAEYYDGIEEEELNDIFRYDEDFVAQMLGYEDYDEMKRDRLEEEEEEEEDYEEEDYEGIEIGYDPYMGCFTDDC